MIGPALTSAPTTSKAKKSVVLLQVTSEQLESWRDRLDHLNALSSVIPSVALNQANRVKNDITTVLEKACASSSSSAS